MITSRDYLVVTLLAVGISGGLAVLGLLLLRLARGRSLLTLVTASIAVSLGPVVAGIVGTSAAMFVTDHDLTIAMLVVVISGVIGAAVALVLGRRLVGAARALRDSSTGVGGPGYTSVDWLPTVELRELAGELDNTHRRLIEALEREHALEASRRELVAWVSHDLRTPLTALRVMAEALEDGVAADPPRYLRQMRQEVEVLNRLVEDLFVLSRLHAGALRLSPQRILVGDLVSDALATLDPVARAGGVRLSGGAESGLSAWVDAAQLGRALANLVHNAIRATPRGGGVRVAAASAPEQVRVSVIDECGGLDSEDLPRLFDVGWQGRSSRPRDGAGLGLAVARGIARAHSGDVEVTNVMGGCSFAIVLPMGGPVSNL